MKFVFALVFLFVFAAFAQMNDPDKIIAEVVNEFNKVQDYSVDVRIKLDVSFIKAPDTEAKIYFKQPDKVNFVSEKFAMVPKEGLDFSPVGLLKKNYTSIYVKEEVLNGIMHSVIKIIPLEDRGDVILSTLWIDNSRKVISKVESSTKTSGTFLMELIYDRNFKYPLPSKMIFTFKFKDGMRGRRNIDPDESSKKEKEEEVTGKVYLNYSNYQVNKGIDDSMFEKKTK